MKHSDIIVHGVQLFRHLQGRHASESRELALARLPLAASRSAARALRSRRLSSSSSASASGDESEDEDFLSSFASAFGGMGMGMGGDDESGGGFDFMSAFGGMGGGGSGDDESGAGGFDLLSMIMGGGLGDESGDDESGDDGFFSAFLGGVGGENDEDLAALGEVMANVEQCGIDIEDMAMKALGAFMMSGDTMTGPPRLVPADATEGNMDFSDPTESLRMIAPVMLALKDDDEAACDETDTARIAVAAEEYLQCSGLSEIFDAFEDTDPEALMQTIESECKPIMDAVMSLDELTDDETEQIDFFGLANPCLRALLGDNPVGNFVRYQYNHIDKTFGCFAKLGEDLPHCVLESPPFEDGDETYSIPLSLSKKFACVLGSSYQPALEMMCVGTYEGLDRCLPQVDAVDVSAATSLCAEEGLFLGKLDIIGMDASVVTGNSMPDFCTDIFEKEGIDTKEVLERLDHYNTNREYGWTTATTSDGADGQAEVASVEAASESSGDFILSMESSKPEESYKSNPADIPSLESLEWEDGEASPVSADSSSARAKFFPFLMAGVVIVGVVALALVVKYARSRLGSSGPGGSKPSASSSKASRKNYAHLAMKMDGNEIL